MVPDNPSDVMMKAPFHVGLWRSWERASMAWKRSRVRIPSGPPKLTAPKTPWALSLHQRKVPRAAERQVQSGSRYDGVSAGVVENPYALPVDTDMRDTHARPIADHRQTACLAEGIGLVETVEHAIAGVVDDPEAITKNSDL